MLKFQGFPARLEGLAAVEFEALPPTHPTVDPHWDVRVTLSFEGGTAPLVAHVPHVDDTTRVEDARVVASAIASLAGVPFVDDGGIRAYHASQGSGGRWRVICTETDTIVCTGLSQADAEHLASLMCEPTEGGA